MKKLIFISPLLLCITFVPLFHGCKKAPEDKKIPLTEEISPAAKTDKSSPFVIKLSPSSPLRSDQITAEVQGMSPKKLRYQWIVNDSEIEKANAPFFKGDFIKKHDRIKVRISVEGEDRTYLSDDVVVKNTPPQILSAKLIPKNPKKGDELRIESQTSDDDNDTVNLLYEWSVNENLSGENPTFTIDKELIKRGDKISVKITPADGEEKGKPITLFTTIANSPPNVSPDIKANFNGLVYTTKITADDPEEDPLTFTLKEGPQGMTIDPKSGVITWQVSQKDKGEHNIVVAVSDGQNSETLVSFTAKINFPSSQ